MLGLLLAAVVAQSPAEEPRVSSLDWNPVIDLPLTGALGAGWLISEFAVKKELAPAACRWCATNGLDDSFRTLFQPRVGPSGASPSDTVSNVFWVSSALLTLGAQALLAWRDDALRGFPIDALIIFEATFAAMAVNQTVKFLVGRERPFVAQLAEPQKALTGSPADNNLSFFSGHATFTMSLAVAAGTVTQLRGYRRGWIVWAIGVPLSLATGALRLSADKHNFTDVAVGWLVGAGIGLAVPWLFHHAEAPLALRLVPAPDGIALAGRF